MVEVREGLVVVAGRGAGLNLVNTRLKSWTRRTSANNINFMFATVYCNLIANASGSVSYRPPISRTETDKQYCLQYIDNSVVKPLNARKEAKALSLEI